MCTYKERKGKALGAFGDCLVERVSGTASELTEKQRPKRQECQSSKKLVERPFDADVEVTILGNNAAPCLATAGKGRGWMGKEEKATCCGTVRLELHRPDT